MCFTYHTLNEKINAFYTDEVLTKTQRNILVSKIDRIFYRSAGLDKKLEALLAPTLITINYDTSVNEKVVRLHFVNKHKRVILSTKLREETGDINLTFHKGTIRQANITQLVSNRAIAELIKQLLC